MSLALRFLLELAALVALGAWGFGLDASLAVRTVAGVAAPLAFAIAWGAFIAPKARWRLADPSKVALELVVFATAAWSLGWPFGGIFFGVVVVSEVLTFTLDQRAF